MSSESMQKHIEKKYKEILSFLPEHDADIIRVQMEQAYNKGRNSGMMSQSFFDYLPLLFVGICFVTFVVSSVVLTLIVNTSWESHVIDLTSSFQTEIGDLKHDADVIRANFNEAHQVCIEKLIECELVKTK